MKRDTKSRHLYPQEIAVLILVFAALLLFGLVAVNVVGSNLFFWLFALFAVGFGALAISRPNWLIYGDKTPAQIAKARKLYRFQGFMIIVFGSICLLFLFLSRHDK